jgi:acetyl-CoA/propionyl-CoA carboxylase biotin carboxyl carrier protein
MDEMPTGPASGGIAASGTRSVLIANRGEIAVRVARTCREMGLRSIAVFAPPDTASPHRDACDIAVPVTSYLDPEAILAAAVAAGADAVHPGYGFLSENADFAEAVVEAGLVWVGPPPAAIRLMGDKGEAKKAAEAAGVPVVPAGTDGGFPVMVKAVAGGGGKGMRVVRSEAELADAQAAAAREALSAFGDERLLIERYLERPRHIEIQVLADKHGGVIHLGERECSLQRRHQKVVEEAPSPVVDAALRAQMGEAAVSLARACGYEGAGTVEFIVADGEFFFLEMNTRLQVEHPVTELVYGVDLVEQQLRVAAGETLSLDVGEPNGWAVEARLYAEDPAAGFLPATGLLYAFAVPSDVRVDSGVRAGWEVSTSYDPMLAKVIAWGADREEALSRLDRALAELVVLGVPTNAGFTRALLALPEVRAGEMDTGLLERVLPTLGLEAPDDLPAAAAVAAFAADWEAQAARSSVPLGWRPDGVPGVWRRSVTLFSEKEELEVSGTPADAVVRVGDRSWRASYDEVSGDGNFRRMELDGVARRYAVHVTPEVIWVARDGHQLELRTRLARGSGAALSPDSLAAPMPGTVLLVNVADGDAVDEGDVLLVMESMKMELSIAAPHAGTVGLQVAAGDKVALGQTLAEVVA